MRFPSPSPSPSLSRSLSPSPSSFTSTSSFPSSFHTTLLLLLILLLFTPLAHSYTITSTYQIQDLISTTLAGFQSEVALGWTAPGTSAATLYTYCGTTYIMGGYGVLGISTTSYNYYFQQKYTALPTHTMIYYSLNFFVLDSWSSATFDSFYLQFDDRVANGWILDVSTHTDNACGAGALDLSWITIYGRVYHTSSTLTFKIVSLLDQDSTLESIGFRDINLLFATPQAPTLEEMCGRKTSMTFTTNQCPCASGQYEAVSVGSGTCKTCHANCLQCFGPSERECYVCRPGYTWNGYACITACDTTCSGSLYTCFGAANTNCLVCNAGLYLTSSNMCLTAANCASPLVQTVSGTVNVCTSPCGLTQYAYWNGSCLSTCPYPLKSSTVSNFKICRNPCTSLQYLYYNQTCSAVCNYPWSARTEGGGVKYCDYLCDVTQVLYWDQTCEDSCLFPLQQYYQNSFRFCYYPCTGIQYLYPNGTCKSTCTSPLTTTVLKGKNLCSSPCTSGQFLYSNGSCSTICDSPYIVYAESVTNYCLPPCQSPTPYYNPNTGTCTSSCNGISFASGLQLICSAPAEEPGFFKKTFLIASTPQGHRSFLALAKSMTYLRILDISAPERLQILMRNQGKPILSLRLGYEMSTQMKSDFNSYSVPSVFSKANYHSDFLVNYWMEASSFLILFAIAAALVFLEKVCEKLRLKGFQIMFERLKIMVLWNVFLILLATGVDELLLATILEFKASYFNSFLSIFNLIICILINGILVAFIADILYLVPRAKSQKDEATSTRSYNNYANFLTKWQNYQVCFRGFNDNASHKRYFYLGYIIRLAIPMLIACLVYDVPLMQTILILLVNICALIYIIKMRPLKSKINHIQLVINESITLVINFSLFMLTMLDLAHASTEKGGIFFGDAAIFGNFCLNFNAVVFLAIKITVVIRQADKLENLKIELKKATFVQALFLPIQQGGFGFEQFQMANFIQDNENKENDGIPLRKDSGQMENENDPFQIPTAAENNYVNNKDQPKFDDGEEYHDEIDDEIEIFALRRK